MIEIGEGSRWRERMMGVTSIHGGGARAVTGVHTMTVGIESQGHGMIRRIEIVATGQNELEIGARIPETDAIDIESVSEGAQVLMAKTQGTLGGKHRAHHCHIELVPLSGLSLD
jgi:hypothetical protein